MDLDPNIWGPHYWATMHFMAAGYDNNPNHSVRATMKNFIQSIPVFLRCRECQDHAFDYIHSSNIDKVIQNRKELFTFFFNFHNSVNQRIKKPLFKIEDALDKYFIPKEEHYLYLSEKKKRDIPIFGYTSNPSNSSRSTTFLILLVVGVIIIFTFR